MSAVPATRIAAHVAAAKRLLEQLDQHADAALEAAARGNGVELLASLERRDALLEELAAVAQQLAHARDQGGRLHDDVHGTPHPLLLQLNAAAHSALASQEELVARTKDARDRLGAALQNAAQPDSVADQYGAASYGARRPILSVSA